MAKIEVDELEYAELKQVADVAKLIGNNPKARPLLQQAVAIAAPERVGPEHRIREEVNEKLSGIEKTLQDFLDANKKEKEEREAEVAKRQLEERWLSGRKKARDAGYTDEGLDKLETYMEKHGVADHEIAIPAFERENPPPEPVATGSSRWNFFDMRDQQGQPDLKALLEGNDEQFLGSAIQSVLNETRGKR